SLTGSALVKINQSILLNMSSSDSNAPDIWRELALLGALEGKPESLQMYKLLTGLSIGQHLYNQVSGQAELAALRQKVVLNIVDYIKKHPKPSEDELAKVVLKEVEAFTKAVEKL
ncbi:hypothetical protein BOX15_Mlig013167g5, partial [Macrostomum lignano]